ncbi:MAG: hypothetical protein GX383_11490 [Clostridium sp.]|nr:hypothetical protein [Clostridium sp.]
MKAYKEYMSKIKVSSTLHQRLVSCAGSGESDHRPIIRKYFAVAVASLVLVLIGIFYIPKLMQNNVPPVQDDNSWVLQPSTDTPVPDEIDKYALVFNKANAQRAKDIGIPGHFWQELTDQELNTIFPGLKDTHTLTATANFQSGENGVGLFNIDAYAVSASGLRTYIRIAPDKVKIDYRFEEETNTSDVLGTKVTAGYFETKPNSNGLRNIIYFATFKLSDAAYYIELGGMETEKEALRNEVTELIVLLIEGDPADLNIFHPVVPELREDRLNLDEARSDADFGAYLPKNLPQGFVFEDALRFINQEQNTLSVNWTKGMGYIDWRVSKVDDKDKKRITSVTDTKNYDLALYPIPRADSVPDELREIVDNPIFYIDELTLEAVQARTYEVSDSGDEPGSRMKFSVLYGDILVELRVKGASPEIIFDILQQINRSL